MSTNTQQRLGELVERPACRLTDDQVRLIDDTSRQLLEDPGILCYNEHAADVFDRAGATVARQDKHWSVSIPAAVIDEVLDRAPSTVVLGARDPDNRLILDGHEPRVRFASGAETNEWLDIEFVDVREEDGEWPHKVPKYARRRGMIEDLKNAAHLVENLDNLDSFIRCVNIQDPEVTSDNKDVNKLFVSLDNTTKHVQAGLTDLGALDDVVRMGEIIAGGPEAFSDNPVVSFIACLVKSPLQMVDDTTEKAIAFAQRQIPMVVSSSPMGGATAPFDEYGMVAQINAEILAGVALTQLVSAGAPVLYGSVPVRTRLDDLNDMYGAPEFVHYNIDCIQMARFYGLPCYSTAGVGDAMWPGVQATAEKMLTLAQVPMAGAQYVHYAFGLLDRTNIFSPEQAILDDTHIGMVKYMMRQSTVREDRQQQVLDLVREVMGSSQKIYVYNLPLPTREDVYVSYPLEDEQGDAVRAAHDRYQEILDRPRKHLPDRVRDEIADQVSGVLPKSLEKQGVPA